MDIYAIREELDESGHINTRIMAYSAIRIFLLRAISRRSAALPQLYKGNKTPIKWTRKQR